VTPKRTEKKSEVGSDRFRNVDPDRVSTCVGDDLVSADLISDDLISGDLISDDLIRKIDPGRVSTCCS
jgi:hypothetical protein